MSLKHFDPSKTFKVKKHFTELGRKFKPGDTYVPRFRASRRVMIRHFITGRIEEIGKKEPTQEVQNEVVEKVDEGVNEDIAQVVVDDGDNFQVEYKGVQFEVSRNQVRKDGTLTSGGLKAYRKALDE